MNRMIFSKPMFRGRLSWIDDAGGMLGVCTMLLGTMPMLAQDNARSTASAAADQAGPPPMGPRGGRMGGRQVEMLTKQLNLTPDQAAQVKAIDEDTMKQTKAVRNDTSLAQADKRSKMMDIRKASQDKIRAVLNDDQKTKYDAMQTQMRERRRERQGGQDAPRLRRPQRHSSSTAMTVRRPEENISSGLLAWEARRGARLRLQ